MAHNGERCLFGKTIIPLSLCHAEPRFATLDDAPIGPVLFDVLKQPPIMRRFATLTPDDTFYQSATRKTTNKSESLYARFTVYPFTQGNLLIYEVFFPVLFEANNSNEK